MLGIPWSQTAEVRVKVINGKLSAGCVVDDELTLNGLAEGDLTASDGADLRLNGMVCGNLQVERGAIVAIHGTVSGKVVMRGGRVEVRGVVGGVIKADGVVTVRQGAVISGERAEEDYHL